MKILKNQITVAAISVGEILAPALLKLTGFIKKGLNAWKSYSTGVKRTIVIIAGIVAAIGPALLLFAGLVIVLVKVGAVISAILSPVGLLVAAIVAGVAALVHFTVGWENALEAVKNFGLKAFGFLVNFRENFGLLTDWLRDNWKNLLVDLGNFIVLLIKSWASNLKVGIETAMRIYTAYAGWMTGMFQKIFSLDFLIAVLDGLAKAGEFIRKWAFKIFDIVTGAFTGDADKIKTDVSKSTRSLIDQVKADFEKGRTDTNLLATVGEILKEQSGKLTGVSGFQATTTPLPQFNLGVEGEMHGPFLEEQNKQVTKPIVDAVDNATMEIVNVQQAIVGQNNLVRGGTAASVSLLARGATFGNSFGTTEVSKGINKLVALAEEERRDPRIVIEGADL